ncbi:clusterin-associated protein 1 homolog [Periplaneta americana]|uniref:clusterin-associated protein 1 homolog n=1 Tax=Periplaneta americana TaxID=6978 RepID=UPI0037E95520
MSYRDLRNFTEMMRALGYTRLISMENFRNPNFPLVAEILLWLVKRFDPDADIATEYDNEQDRVILVRSAAQFMASKANIKLNTKRIYQADGYAVRELLKATSVLYNALRVNTAILADDTSSVSSPVDISSKIHELMQTRQLASQITTKGAGLYDLLGKEVEMRELRNMRVSRQLEMTEVETAVRQALETIKQEIANTKQLMENVSASEASLDSKIEKKRNELERNQKRLQTLKKVRPAFLEEFERLEVELQQLYQDYLVRFRCLAYLEQQQDEAEQAEQERMEKRQAHTKKLLEQMRQEDKSLDGSGDIFEPGEIKEEEDELTKLGVGKASRVRIKTASGVMRKASAAGQQTRRVFGSMNAPPDEEDDSGSLDSDSDLLLDGEGSELLGSEEEDEELELGLDAPVNKEKRSASRLHQEHSDDDF